MSILALFHEPDSMFLPDLVAYGAPALIFLVAIAAIAVDDLRARPPAMIRRCAYHPGGKTLLAWPNAFGQALAALLEQHRAHVPGGLTFTDGICPSCAARVNAEMDAAIAKTERR